MKYTVCSRHILRLLQGFTSLQLQEHYKPQVLMLGDKQLAPSWRSN